MVMMATGIVILASHMCFSEHMIPLYIMLPLLRLFVCDIYWNWASVRAYSHQRRAFFLLRKFCCGYIKIPYI